MITNVKLYECLGAVDYYYLDENGEVDGRAGDLTYTNDNCYVVEWYDEDVSIPAQNCKFSDLNDALALYREMKAKEKGE